MYEHGKSGELIPAREVPEEAIAAFERADEEAIVQHMAGLDLQGYIYSFEIDKKEVIGIGWAGAREMACIRGHLEVIDFRADRQAEPIPDNPKEDEEVYYVGVRVRDNLTGVTFLGTGRQPKFKTLRDGTRKFDRSSFTIAINKGQRNGFLYHIPEEAKKAIIQRFIEQGKVKRLPPSYGGTPLAGQTKELKPPTAKATKPPAQELGYTDLKEQEALRRKFYHLLTDKDTLHMTPEQAKEFVRGDTIKWTKAELEAKTAEAEQMLEVYRASKAGAGGTEPEQLPF